MKNIKIILMIAGVSLLTGCEFNAVDSAKKKVETPATTTPAQKCNQWCHNGWCTTHCDDVITSS